MNQLFSLSPPFISSPHSSSHSSPHSLHPLHVCIMISSRKEEKKKTQCIFFHFLDSSHILWPKLVEVQMTYAQRKLSHEETREMETSSSSFKKLWISLWEMKKIERVNLFSMNDMAVIFYCVVYLFFLSVMISLWREKLRLKWKDWWWSRKKNYWRRNCFDIASRVGLLKKNVCWTQ